MYTCRRRLHMGRRLLHAGSQPIVAGSADTHYTASVAIAPEHAIEVGGVEPVGFGRQGGAAICGVPGRAGLWTRLPGHGPIDGMGGDLAGLRGLDCVGPGKEICGWWGIWGMPDHGNKLEELRWKGNWDDSQGCGAGRRRGCGRFAGQPRPEELSVIRAQFESRE